MNEYQIGKDIQNLDQRIKALESKFCSKSEDEGIKFSEELVPIEETEQISEKNYRLWHFLDPRRTGKCEIRGGSDLQIFPDGRYKVTGTRKCNSGGIISCKKFGVKIKLWYKESGEWHPFFEKKVKEGLLGPGSEREFDSEGQEPVIEVNYNREVLGAQIWIPSCEWGV